MSPNWTIFRQTAKSFAELENMLPNWKILCRTGNHFAELEHSLPNWKILRRTGKSFAELEHISPNWNIFSRPPGPFSKPLGHLPDLPNVFVTIVGQNGDGELAGTSFGAEFRCGSFWMGLGGSIPSPENRFSKKTLVGAGGFSRSWKMGGVPVPEMGRRGSVRALDGWQ